MVLYPSNVLSLLDFDKVLREVCVRAWCEEGLKLLEEQGFISDDEELRVHLKAVAEGREMIASGQLYPETGFVQSADIVTALRTKGLILEIDQFIRLYRLLKGSDELLRYFAKKGTSERFPVLSSLTSALEIQPDWYQRIEKVIHLEEEIVRSDASAELVKIRTKLSKLYKQRESAFVAALKKYGNAGFLADQKEGFREGKRVLAVLSEHKRQVQGMILDTSGSGAITYIEPAVVMPYNSDISGWLVEERKEIRKILLELSIHLHPFADIFEELRKVIAQLDAFRAKSAYCEDIDATMPSVTKNKLIIKNGRHPILEKHLKKLHRKIVPLDLELDSKQRIIVISGPNAGGKSVAMKTAGLFQLMAQFGLHLPSDDGSAVKCFRELLVDIGDDQSMEDDLSTYSSHLLKMRHFLEHAGEDSLVLIDEMGSGTDPSYGGAIAEAVLEALDRHRVYGVVTTHYSNLKGFAYNTEGMRNAAMSFNNTALTPTYQLLIGQAGASYALEIAQRSGLPAGVIKRAQDLMGEGKKEVERNLSQIQSEKQYLKGIRKNNQKQAQHLEKLIKDYEQLKRQLEKNKKRLERQYEERLLADYNEANRKLENEIRESRQQKEVGSLKKMRVGIDEKRKSIASKLSSETIEPVQENEAPIELGSSVKIEESNAIGTVTEIRKGKASVQIGALTTTVPLHKLVHLQEKKEQNSPSRTAAKSGLEEQSQFDLDLDIRGKYKDEALLAVEQFLDRAVMFGISRLRIIHGRGSGALRQMVHQCLKNYPHVASYEKEAQESGGDGVTVVTMQ